MLVTSRAAFARQISALAPDIAVTSTAPEAVTVQAWVSAPVVVIDCAALPMLRARALPAASHIWVVTDGPPVPAVFVDAVKLRVDRMVELPLGGPWLASALGPAARRGSVQVHGTRVPSIGHAIDAYAEKEESGMRLDIQQQIHHAAQAAYEAVWDAAPPSAAPMHSGALYAEIAGIEDRAAGQYRQAVRDQCAALGVDQCAALGVDECDYYLADRDAAVVFQPGCLAGAVTQYSGRLPHVTDVNREPPF